MIPDPSKAGPNVVPLRGRPLVVHVVRRYNVAEIREAIVQRAAVDVIYNPCRKAPIDVKPNEAVR